MKYPKFLNDKLNLIAPSFGCTTEPYYSRLNMAIKHFNALGISCINGINIYASIGPSSASCKNRAKEFVDAYKDNNFILSVGGGNLLSEIIDYIDFNELSLLPPTYFMGYSDNTYLTFLLTTLCDVASIYGYNAPEFGSLQLDCYTLNQIALMRGEKLEFSGYPYFELNSLKSDDNPYAGYNLDTKKELVLVNSDSINAHGRLIGGCIDCLTYLVGTKYDKVCEFSEKYKDDSIIWFLESCDLEAWNLELALLHMKRAGWFKNVSLIMIGRPYKYNTDFIGLTMNDAVKNALKDLGIPIIINADFGHLKPCIPLICGALASVSAQGNDLKIKYELK